MFKEGEDLVAVCEILGASGTAIFSRSRKKEVVWQRHRVMWALRRYFGYTYVKIGMLLGRDHSTVVHAVKKEKSFSQIELLRLEEAASRKARCIVCGREKNLWPVLLCSKHRPELSTIFSTS